MKITSKPHLMGPVSILLPMLIAWCFDRGDTKSCVPNASLLPHEQHEQRSLFPHDYDFSRGKNVLLDVSQILMQQVSFFFYRRML